MGYVFIIYSRSWFASSTFTHSIFLSFYLPLVDNYQHIIYAEAV